MLSVKTVQESAVSKDSLDVTCLFEKQMNKNNIFKPGQNSVIQRTNQNKTNLTDTNNKLKP